MVRRTILAGLLLAATLPAQENPLASHLRPIDGRYLLEPHDATTFKRLGARERLIARGLDPALYTKAPAFADAIEQAHNIKHLLRPGYRHAERLSAKKRAVRSLLRRLDAVALVRGLRGVERWTPDEFRRRFAGSIGRNRRQVVSQPIQALRRNERQFQQWLVAEVARKIDEQRPVRRVGALDELVRGLHHGHPQYRITCAEVLGGIDDPMAASALERRFAEERVPEVRVAIVRARVRHGGAQLAMALRRWADDPDHDVRTEVLRGCRGADRKWLLPFLRWRSTAERGRLRDDLMRLWPADLAKPDAGKRVEFYGIRTSSRRIAFCIDVSRSMLFPMDGLNGKREPRIEKTRRELFRTLERLPRDVEFTIILFGTRVVSWQKTLVPATPENRDAAVEYVDKPRILNGTNVFGPVRTALGTGADTIFLLTDGEPNSGTVVDPALIVEAVADLNRYKNRVIHTIGLSQDQNAELLANLAARCGGRYEVSR